MTRARDVANIDGILTTTGDTFYASSGGTPARLGIGSTDQVLKVNGGIPSWGAAPTPTFVGCQIYKSGSQALTTSTWTTITFDTESFDTDNFHSTVTNTSRMTIPAGKAGYYRADLNAMGYNWTLWQYRLLLNGTAVSSTFVNNGMTNGTENMTYVSWTLSLAVGDYIEWQGWQNAGANRNINFTTQFNLSYLGV